MGRGRPWRLQLRVGAMRASWTRCSKGPSGNVAGSARTAASATRLRCRASPMPRIACHQCLADRRRCLAGPPPRHSRTGSERRARLQLPPCHAHRCARSHDVEHAAPIGRLGVRSGMRAVGVRQVVPRRHAAAAVQTAGFEATRGEAFTIVGFSGSGKSTPLRYATSIEPTAGSVHLAGTDLTVMPEARSPLARGSRRGRRGWFVAEARTRARRGAERARTRSPAAYRSPMRSAARPGRATRPPRR